MQSAACDSRNFLLVNNGLTVLPERDQAADKCDVVGLPFPRPAWLFRRSCQEAIHTSRAHCRSFWHGIVFDLNFVSTPQVDTTVRFRSAIEFDMQLEVFELRIGDEVRTMSGTQERSVFDLPGSRCIRIARPPPAQVLAIDQRRRVPPLRFGLPLQIRRPLACPLPRSPILPARRPAQFLPRQCAHKYHVVFPVFFVLGRDECYLPM